MEDFVLYFWIFYSFANILYNFSAVDRKQSMVSELIINFVVFCRHTLIQFFCNISL